MQLSNRLLAVAGMVTEGNTVADVGCDHGYIPIYLIQQKKIPCAIAMDIRRGPLSRAEAHIEENGLREYIQTRLSDGVQALKPGEADTLIIAGMGEVWYRRFSGTAKKSSAVYRNSFFSPSQRSARYDSFCRKTDTS